MELLYNLNPNVTVHSIRGDKRKQRWRERSQRRYKHTDKDKECKRFKDGNTVQPHEEKLKSLDKTRREYGICQQAACPGRK
jgi:hypothetical protein